MKIDTGIIDVDDKLESRLLDILLAHAYYNGPVKLELSLLNEFATKKKTNRVVINLVKHEQDSFISVWVSFVSDGENENE